MDMVSHKIKIVIGSPRRSNIYLTLNVNVDMSSYLSLGFMMLSKIQKVTIDEFS